MKLFKDKFKEEYTLRERVSIYASGLAAYLGTTAAIRYTALGFTNDWEEEAIHWGVSALASLPVSIPSRKMGQIVGEADVLTQRGKKQKEQRERLNLEDSLD